MLQQEPVSVEGIPIEITCYSPMCQTRNYLHVAVLEGRPLEEVVCAKCGQYLFSVDELRPV